MFEAEQLARVRAGRIDMPPVHAKRKRAELLSVHLKSRSSGERLRRRINEMLARPRPVEVLSVPSGDALEEYASLEDFDPYDSTHLLWEQIKQPGFAFREISREDVTDEDIEQLIEAYDLVWNILLCIQHRKQQPT